MTDLDKIKLWEYLKKDFISKIKDYNTRKLYYKTLLVTATKEFGFNPEKCIIQKNNQIQLDEWEKEFVEDIKKAQIYEINTRSKKRHKEIDEAEKRMEDFIEKNGSFTDLPEDLRTKEIYELYIKCLIKNIDDLIKSVDL